MEVLLDIIIANNLYANSYFFLSCINTKKLNYILFIGLIIDLLILNTMGLITTYLLLAFILTKKISNYYIKNFIIYLSFIILFSIIFKNNILNILISSLIPQIIFIYLMKNAYD